MFDPALASFPNLNSHPPSFSVRILKKQNPLQFPKHTSLFCQPLVPMGVPALFLQGSSCSSDCLEKPHLHLDPLPPGIPCQDTPFSASLSLYVVPVAGTTRGVSLNSPIAFLPYSTRSSLRAGILYDVCLCKPLSTVPGTQ